MREANDDTVALSTADSVAMETESKAAQPMTRAEVVAANRLRQHEEPHEEMDACKNAAGAGSAELQPQSSGQNQTHARFWRWGELLLAGVGEAGEVTSDQHACADGFQERGAHQVGELGQREEHAHELQKELKMVPVQRHHFQNLFVFATRGCCINCV